MVKEENDEKRVVDDVADVGCSENEDSPRSSAALTVDDVLKGGKEEETEIGSDFAAEREEAYVSVASNGTMEDSSGSSRRSRLEQPESPDLELKRKDLEALHQGRSSSRRVMDEGLKEHRLNKRRSSASRNRSCLVEVVNTKDRSMTVTVRDAFEEYLIPLMSSMVSHNVEAMRQEGNDLILVVRMPSHESTDANDLAEEIKATLDAARREQQQAAAAAEVSELHGKLLESKDSRLRRPPDDEETVARNELTSLERNLMDKGVAKAGVAVWNPNDALVDEEFRKTQEAIRRVSTRSSLTRRGELSPGAYYASGRACGDVPDWETDVSDEYLAPPVVGDSMDLPLAATSANIELAHERANGTVEAFRVDEEAHEEGIRQKILDEAVEADVVDHVAVNKKRKRCIVFWILLTVVLVAVAIVLSVGLVGNNSTLVLVTESPTMTPTTSPTEILRPTIEKVKERGTVICGVSDDHHLGGFNRDLCRAVTAAVLGDPSLVEFVNMTRSARFPALNDGDVDLLIRLETHTMDRDVAERSTGVGFSFSSPFLYSGFVFSGEPAYVDCAERLDTFFGFCRQLRVCVNKGTSLVDIVQQTLPSSFVVTTMSANEAFVEGKCNVVANEPVVSHEEIFRELGYKGEFMAGTTFFSREPLAAVTRPSDPEWSELVNAVLHVLWAAEAQNVTQTSAAAFDTSPLFGNYERGMLVNVIAAAGNYGEIFSRHLDGVVTRTGLNSLNVDATGLLYSLPFGNLERNGPTAVQGGKLQSILDRGYLRCGLSSNITGFTEFSESSQDWTGLDVSFCRVLSAAVFAGEIVEHLEYKSYSEEQLQDALFAGEVDVLAVGSADLAEGTAATTFRFSPPYFYGAPDGTLDDVSTRALVTRREDTQFCTFVYWAVMATIYAEENFIDQSKSSEMPVVNLFGDRFVQMFRDVILAGGHYGEIYEEALGSTIPRAGRNELNIIPYGGQQFSYHFP